MLVGHRVDDVVDPKSDGKSRESFWIERGIGALPRGAPVGVERNCHHYPPFVVVDASPVRDVAIELMPFRQMRLPWDLITLVEVIDGMENRIRIGDLDDRAIRKGPPHALFEDLPLDSSVEVVRHKE